MSKENLDKFMEDLKSNLLLKHRLDDLLKEINNFSETDKKEKIVEFANSEGYDFNVSDFLSTSDEISYDELFNVAGGVNSDFLGLDNCIFVVD